jgi:hypothetical protein
LNIEVNIVYNLVGIGAKQVKGVPRGEAVVRVLRQANESGSEGVRVSCPHALGLYI